MSRVPVARDEPLLILGETSFRRERRRFGLLPADRLRHLYILGKTGSGKSTLVQNLVAQDLAAGRGLAVLDPHGDLVDGLLPIVPEYRIPHVLLFAPEDRDYPVSFNIFRAGKQPQPDRALFVSQLVSVFRKNWADSWGPRLEHVLRNATLAVAEHPQATLVLLYRFLTSEPLRERLLEYVTDPVVKAFWTSEFPLYSKALQGEALAPALNKLGAFVANPIVRNIVGQERSRVDWRDFLDRGGVLLGKLSVGKIGEDASHLLGALLVSSLQLAALERTPGSRPFYLYLDEFQHFVTESIGTILSESRKFGLAVTLSHQYLGQLPLSLQQAVLGNAGSLVIFRVGAEDARQLANEFLPVFTGLDLQELPRYHAAMKVTARGESLRPFSALTLHPPLSPEDGARIADQVRQRSRERFAISRDQAERATRRHLKHND